jgi:hypothetical protein
VPDRLHLVPEQIDPHRLLGTRREQVDDATAAGDRPRFLDERRRLVAEVGRPAEQRVDAHAVANPDAPRPFTEPGWVDHELQRAVDRGHDHRRRCIQPRAPQPVEHRDPAGRGRQVERELFVGERFRRRPEGGRPLGRQVLGQGRAKRFRPVRAGGQDERRSGRLRENRGRKHRTCRGGQIDDGEPRTRQSRVTQPVHDRADGRIFTDEGEEVAECHRAPEHAAP